MWRFRCLTDTQSRSAQNSTSRSFAIRWLAMILFLAGLSLSRLRGADEPIPHNQDAPPGPALSPEEAVNKMTVPPGFSVEIVACEPDLVNPVAMTFDERGRIWVTESFEYPRREPGPGRDRIKILQDTDQDGRVDKVTIFAEGLNIPSGIAVGAGGVWVANSPDILFMQDTDGDDVADKQEVVVTGFGRDDTHELPNSLTWGPDGWLYGLNGVFNASTVQQGDRTYNFTCALFRIHPVTRKFELFAEGTSNPWGVAFDDQGSAFVSACVIDHLWHLVESGYYHRQGGPYPPFTWKMESIVKHKHQKAAYCGLHYFDSDAYPEEFRGKFYMGNIHGNCINSDAHEPSNETYQATARPDFLSANDAWFMPVVQKTGPDGCLYVLDWYDRYHCYQDANRDPAGIDRGKGRLYRIRYQDTPRAGKFDLSRERDEQLIERLHSPNVFFRDVAQRVLSERLRPGAEPGKRKVRLQTQQALMQLVADANAPRKARMHALWALIGSGPLEERFHAQLLNGKDPSLRAWGVRAAGNEPAATSKELRRQVLSLYQDPDPTVRLQAVVAAAKLTGPKEGLQNMLSTLEHSADNPVIPHVVWQNAHPRLIEHADVFLSRAPALAKQGGLVPEFLIRAYERLLSGPTDSKRSAAALLALLAAVPERSEATARCLDVTISRWQSGEFSAEDQHVLKDELRPLVESSLESRSKAELRFSAARILTIWGEPSGIKEVRKVLADIGQAPQQRLQALAALVTSNDPELPNAVTAILSDTDPERAELRRRTIDTLGGLQDIWVAKLLLAQYAELDSEIKPAVIEVLTGRAPWAKLLLESIADKKLPAEVINLNQVRKLQASSDADLVKAVNEKWGVLRADRNVSRELVMARMRQLIRSSPGDAVQGRIVYRRVCGQCHKLHGEGQEVGPDITANGRNSFEQLLSNVFDPSLVIGASYRAHTVNTADGRVITGLLAVDEPERIVLKVQGGKLETIARADIDEMEASKLSLMPEDLERQLKPHELIDLFAYITLDKPPENPEARQLPGVRSPLPRRASNPLEFAPLVAEVAPGFSIERSGEGGIQILKEHFGKAGVLQTHPVNPREPCVLSSQAEIPANKSTKLIVEVSHHPRGNWQLSMLVNGKELQAEVISEDSTNDHWKTIELDLTPFANQTVKIELRNGNNQDWSNEFGYWSRVEIVSE